jgi:hypothetical protein
MKTLALRPAMSDSTARQSLAAALDYRISSRATLANFRIARVRGASHHRFTVPGSAPYAGELVMDVGRDGVSLPLPVRPATPGTHDGRRT